MPRPECGSRRIAQSRPKIDSGVHWIFLYRPPATSRFDGSGTWHDLRLSGLTLVACLGVQIRLDRVLGDKLQTRVDIGRSHESTGSQEHEGFEHRIKTLHIGLLV